MDWDLAIERNREALKRIVAMLVAMAGLADSFTSPLWGGRWSSDHRVGVSSAPQPPPDASRRPPHKGEVKPAFTLPRHLRNAILRLLRPAESAVRRLIIVAARGLVVTLPPPRPRGASPTPLAPVLRGLGIAVVTSGFAAATTPGRAAAGPRKPTLPLLDPLKSFGARRRCVPAHAAPRILGLDLEAPYRPLPAPPSPDDLLDATRITLRLAALGAALDDLPGQAKRFARWRARGAVAAGAQSEKQPARRDAACAQNRNRTRRTWPLRPGRAPGQLKAKNHRQEVHEVLSDLHWFAFEALEAPDTS